MRKNNFLRKAVHPLFVIGLTLPLLATHCEEFEDIPSIKICDSILEEYDEMDVGEERVKLPTPAQIKAHLDEYVIGQDEAKKTLAIAVYNHYKRVFSNDKSIQKSIESYRIDNNRKDYLKSLKI